MDMKEGLIVAGIVAGVLCCGISLIKKTKNDKGIQ